MSLKQHIKDLQEEIISRVEYQEGFSKFVYKDTLGINTIGYGFNLDDVGLSKAESVVILRMRLKKLSNILYKKYFWYKKLSDPRKLALLDMAYQMGIYRQSKFANMLQALKFKDYDKASEECLNSKWARETPTRAEYVAKILKGDEIC